MRKLNLRQLLLFFIFACCNYKAAAQKQPLRILLLDAETRSPLNGVTILKDDGTVAAKTDELGYATSPAEYKYLVAVHEGYKPDTVYNSSDHILFLQPLQVSMKDVIIKDKQVKRVLHSAQEYVVDYEFAGNDLLVATYSGNNGNKAKLFLLNNKGDTLAWQRLPEEPLALFKSCIGKYYCVCSDKFYPITFKEGTLELQQALDIKLLPLLKECEQYSDNNYYYRRVEKEVFRSTYSLKEAADTASKIFYEEEQHKTTMGSAEELAEIMSMYNFGNFSGAAKLAGIRKLRNDLSVRSMDIPLYKVDDSLVIFDLNDAHIRFFGMDGSAVAASPVNFVSDKLFRFNIIQDKVNGRFYMCSKNAGGTYILEELDIHSGKKIDKPVVALQKPLVEKIKVHNGNIYYLWQDASNNATRQLFVQQSL